MSNHKLKNDSNKPLIYLIGSLGNKRIPFIGNKLRKLGFEVFDQWWTPGPLADRYLEQYAKIRKFSYKETLHDVASTHVYSFDKSFLDKADLAIMIMNCGKSGHMELGYIIGSNKPGYILFEKEPDRLDIMHQFATDIFFKEKDLFKELRKYL